jgi:hypothetical protein
MQDKNPWGTSIFLMWVHIQKIGWRCLWEELYLDEAFTWILNIKEHMSTFMFASISSKDPTIQIQQHINHQASPGYSFGALQLVNMVLVKNMLFTLKHGSPGYNIKWPFNTHLLFPVEPPDTQPQSPRVDVTISYWSSGPVDPQQEWVVILHPHHQPQRPCHQLKHPHP